MVTKHVINSNKHKWLMLLVGRMDGWVRQKWKVDHQVGSWKWRALEKNPTNMESQNQIPFGNLT